MKLTNPTDDQLDAAFAERVAGLEWMEGEAEPGYDWIRGWHKDGEVIPDCPDFTTSADAVLPWLEKCADSILPLGGPIVIMQIEAKWHVRIGEHRATHVIFAKAAVIALLRANGVEVVFSK